MGGGDLRRVYELSESDAEPAVVLSLPFDQRTKSRLRVALGDGSELALLLPRGTMLRGGMRLRAEDGTIIGIAAAPETVSTVVSADAFMLLRAAYHLGNRHVPLELGRGFVRYQHDHVLDAMVEELGLRVQVEEAPFEPEGGAYGHGHGHGHEAEHSHDAGHPHEAEHSHDHGAHSHGHGRYGR
jgi:urease accessory protein